MLTLKTEQLRRLVCLLFFIRGLNKAGLLKIELEKKLLQWMEIAKSSGKCQARSLSYGNKKSGSACLALLASGLWPVL